MSPYFQYTEVIPHADAYNQLRRSVGWHVIDSTRAEAGLQASLYCISIKYLDQLIAFGRIVGDDAVYFYLQDVMVDPAFRGQKLGKAIMTNLMNYIDQHAVPKSGAFIGLMIAPGLEGFYSQFGFKALPDDSPALGIWRNGHD